jgi:hypothetical protein
MTAESVIAILGKPGSVAKDEAARGEQWIYWEDLRNIKPGGDIGGVQVILQNAVVIKVLPIHTDTGTYGK